MSARPPLAKLTAPTLPAHVPRPRLFTLLDRARKRRVVWITAIPGSGKTSLVASYLRARRQRCVWISLDEADSDPATFLYYVRLAAEAASPRARTPLPSLSPEYLPQLTVFAQRFFVALYQRLSPRTAIVLDNYQTLHADSPVHELVRIATTHAPRDSTMFVMSRGAAPAALARLQAEQQIAVIGEPVLRLNRAETTQLLGLHAARHRRRNLAAESKRLHAATGGWLAGTLLLVMHAGGTERSTVASTPRLLFDYFATEVLAQLDPVSRKVLITTALLPSMTASMAQTLTGEPSAGRIVADLHRAGRFTQQHSEAPTRYQYHPLFREFLLSRVAADLAPEDFSALQQQAASLLADDGQIEAAIALWTATRRFDRVAVLVHSRAPLLIGQARGGAVIDWITAIPEAARDEAPWLWFWLGAAHMAAQPLHAQPLLERALRGFERCGDGVGALLACAAVVDAIAYAWRDVARLDVWIERLAELAASVGDGVPPPVDAAVACTMCNALFWRRPGDVRFAAWAAKVERVIETAPELDMRVAAVTVAVLNAHINKGDLGAAERLLRTVEDRVGKPGTSPFAMLACFQMRAVLTYTVGEAEASLRAAKQGLEFAVEHGVSFWNVPLLGAQCLAELQLGDIAAAQRSVEQMLAQSRDGGMAFRSWTLCLQSWVEHERGNVRAAHRAVQSAVQTLVQEGPFPEMLGRLSLAQTEHALGHTAEAAAQLARLAEIAREARCPLGEVGWRCMAAQFAFSAGDVPTALTELRAALRLGATIGYYGWQGRIPRDDLGFLFAQALETGIEPEYVGELIRCRRLLPAPAAAHVEAWPWPIKIYCLGRFAWVRDGVSIELTGKTQKRPLDLLKMLLAYGGRDVDQGRIAGVLWPQAEGDAAAAAFNTTLKRLRELLGRADAVTLSAGKLALNPRVCWVDAWAFERGLRLAANDSAAAATALAAYGGPFLGSDDRDWAEPPRERLRAHFLRRLRSLGTEFEEQGRWDAAAALYERGLDADDSAEELYQRLMACHDRLGQRSDALAVYRRCKKRLKAHAGIEPSAKTQKLYERLLSS